jgi:hypothetical protein
MGDHRARIKIEMEFHGVKDSCDMWINYWPDGEYADVDDRIIQFIRQVYAEGMDVYEGRMRNIRKREVERRERAELARLKAMYEKEGK